MVEVELGSERVVRPAEEAVHLAARMHARADLRGLGENALEGLAATYEVAFSAGCTRLSPDQVRQPFFLPIRMQIMLYSRHADHDVRSGATYTREWTTKVLHFHDGYPGTLTVGSGSTIAFWAFGPIGGAVVRAS